VLDGSVSFPEARRWLANVRRAGEPWIFGLAPGDVAGFLGDRGFVLVSDVSTKQAASAGSPLWEGVSAAPPLPRCRGPDCLMPKLSDEHRDRRRRQILDAAMACFDRHGLHATTTDEIVAEAGLSAGAIYRYFDSKDAIIEAVAAERHARERSLLADALVGNDPGHRCGRSRAVLRLAGRPGRTTPATSQRICMGGIAA